MITITGNCQHCDWTWRPRKAQGPDRDYERATAAARTHSRQNRGHAAQAHSVERATTHMGSSIRSLKMEITRR